MATGTKRSGPAPREVRAMRGYFRGTARAANYLDIDRQTFRDWRDDPEMPNRHLLSPRIIRGDPYYKIANLDTFMDPANNAPGAAIAEHISNN